VLPPAIVRPAAAIWRVGLPPASVWPAAALRVGGGGGKGGVHLILFRRRCRQDGRRVLGAAMWRGGFPPASVWPAVALRVGGGGRAREASTCYWSAACVDKTGGACWGRPCGGARCRRRLNGRRRLCVLRGVGNPGRRPLASAPPPASARPAARAGGGHVAGRVAAGVRMAGGGSACWGGRAGEGGVHLFLLRRRRRQDRRRVLGAGIVRGGLPPALVWPAAALRVGGGDKQGRQLAVTGPLPELARPAAGVSGGEGRLCAASGVCAAGGGHLAGRVAAGVGMAGGGSAC